MIMFKNNGVKLKSYNGAVLTNDANLPAQIINTRNRPVWGFTGPEMTQYQSIFQFAGSEPGVKKR